MKVTQVSVIYKKTVQMRQFEPVEVSQSAQAQVDEGEDPRQVFIKLMKIVKEQVDDEIQAKKIERKRSFQESESLEKVT